MQLKYSYKSQAKLGRIRRQTPEIWISGPDVYQHELFYAWHKHRAQAHYRKEEYQLTFEDWQKIWVNPMDFANRGRQPEDLTLTRLDPDLAWSPENCIVITRLEQLRRAMAHKMAKKHDRK